jgi:hypothetical protein
MSILLADGNFIWACVCVCVWDGLSMTFFALNFLSLSLFSFKFLMAFKRKPRVGYKINKIVLPKYLK